jgi:hypothetical protein
MPYIIRHRHGKWLTINAETGRILGRHETKKKAESQARLVMAVEHGWIPKKVK